MNRITELALSFFDLVEAEGRELRRQSLSVLRQASIFFFGGLLLTAGVIVAVCALWLALAKRIGQIPAALVSAAVLIAVGGLLIMRSLQKTPDHAEGAEYEHNAEDREEADNNETHDCEKKA